MAVIEYFYAAHSGYAYIGSKLPSEVAAAGGRTDRPPALRLASFPGGERTESDQRADAATPSVFLRP